MKSDLGPLRQGTLIQDAKDTGRAIDCTSGRRTRGVIITDSDHIILSAIQAETIAARIAGEAGGDADE